MAAYGRRRRWVGIGAALVAALAAGAAFPAGATAQDVGLALGSRPTSALVEDLEGNSVDLAQFIGRKPVLVEFWATWCALCRALEPTLAAAQKRFTDRVEILVVGVGVNQTPRQIKRHLETHAPPGRVFFDAKGAAVRAFQTPTTSYIVILDASGKVAYTGTGEDQPIVETLARIVGH
jgi:thiol-disulfide isomerase/thioredoxin